MTRSALALLAVWALGCSGPEPLARREHSISGGRSAPEAEAVVAVVNFAGGQCSGVALLPNLVLTARHCVAETNEPDSHVRCEQTRFEAPDSAGALFVVPVAEVSDDPADYHAVSAIRLPPGDGAGFCGQDIALLRLKAPLDQPLLVPRLDQAVAAGEAYSALGYGEDGPQANEASGIRRRVDALEVRCLGGSCVDRDVRESEWLGSGGVCPGDSGGPALDAREQVVGVVSRGLSDCSSPIYAHVFAWADWLRSEALEAAELASSEPPDWARGDSSEPLQASDALDSSCALTGGRPGSGSRGWWLYALGLFYAVLRRVWRGRAKAQGAKARS